MKNKKETNKKKLSVKKQTLSRLSEKDLKTVKGGRADCGPGHSLAA